jgi:hypothetical protein
MYNTIQFGVMEFFRIFVCYKSRKFSKEKKFLFMIVMSFHMETVLTDVSKTQKDTSRIGIQLSILSCNLCTHRERCRGSPRTNY